MITGAHFILYVADQARSTAFYTLALGSVPTLDVPGMTQFALPGGATLGLMPAAGIKRLLERLPDPHAGAGVPRAELYLLVDDPAAYLARAIGGGAEALDGVRARDWGDDAGYCLDLDGHVLGFARPS